MPASSHILASSEASAASTTLSKTPAKLPPADPNVGKATSKETLKHKSIYELQPVPYKPQPVQNRVSVLLVHIPKFSIQGQARLAAEVGVSRSTVSRLVHGRINPSYRLAKGITNALERMLRKPLDMREVFSTDGTYLTPSGCALCQCNGCLPDRAYDPEGNLRPEWQGQRPGDWSLTRPANPGPSMAGSTMAGLTISADAGHNGVAHAGEEAL